MIERLVEDWLASATERSFQTPFCHTLTNKGMTVLHLTRHGEMEIGKDVIAVDRQGTPHAYQLKTPSGPRITMSEWRKDIAAQVFDLVTTAVIHPSLPETQPHRSFLVTNKGIDESVMRAIADLNRRWAGVGQGHLKLETIVGGELLRELRRSWNELMALGIEAKQGTPGAIPTGRKRATSEGKALRTIASYSPT